MFAIIRTGGKQYRVAADDVIEVEKLAGDPGDAIEFGDVLMLAGEGDLKLGAPMVAGALVAGEVVEQKRADKIIVFKKKRRKGYRRKRGHRQDLTAIRITGIMLNGEKQTAKAEAAPKKTRSRKKATDEAPAEQPAAQQ